MVRELTGEEFEELCRDDPCVIDVRDREAFEAGHVPGAVPLPTFLLLDQLSSLKDQLPIVVVADERPEQALNMLAGYRDIGPDEVFFLRLDRWEGELLRSEDAAERCEELTSEEFRDRMEQGCVAVDVRTAREHGMIRIPGTVNVPFNELRSADLEGEELLLYCNSGRKSRATAEAVADLFDDVAHLARGINDWMKSGLPVEGEYADELF